MSDAVVLEAGKLRLEIWPHTGGAIAGFTHDGFALMRPTAPGTEQARDLSSYPLVPFSGRVANARFTFDGVTHSLWRNAVGGPHAIHGEGWVHPWRTAEATGTAARIVFDHPGTVPESWPFAFRAEQAFTLSDSALHVTMSVRNTGAKRMPAGMGLHPFFPRHAGVRLGFDAGSVWLNGADHLPDAQVAPPPDWRFDPPRMLAEPKLDNCYAGWTGTTTIDWPDAGLGLAMSADPVFGHAVVYTPPGRDHFAFEPVSHMSDAINRMGTVPDHGLVVLEPGAVLAGIVRFTLRRPA